MSKNEEKEVEETEVDETEVDETTEEKTEEETTDWESKFKEEEGRRKRAETKLSKTSEKKEEKTKTSSKSDLDYGQKAFLIANGIKGSDESELVKDMMSNTGKTLDEVVESKYFQAELKEMRDLKQTKDATPKGSKRTGQTAKTQVEYWLAKGELPPASDPKLRQEVVNARIKTEKNVNVFTDNPVIK